MKISRRNFLKSIGAASLAVTLGNVSDLADNAEYQLTAQWLDSLSKYIHWETMRMDSCNISAVVSIDRRWVQNCIVITDQFNRRWSILGYFKSLKSPEGWIFPLDTET